MKDLNLFHFLGRYFWALCICISAYHYVVGMRSLASRDAGDPRVSPAAIALRRWFAVAGALPWAAMGWAIVIGGVPNIWYFFRPQDRNPYVLTWFATVFAIAVYFAFWVFLLEGAQKVVVLQPFEIRWHRTGFRGNSQGTVELTVGRVKLFAAVGPIWIAAWIWLVSLMDAPLPK
jgi:hypothetical protein